MSDVILRPYQDRGVTDIRAAFLAGVRRVLFQSPTGSGKTVLFSYIVENAVARGNRVVILGHRQEIVDQISDALTRIGVTHGMIAAGYLETPEAAVQVASVATLVRRLERLERIDLVVVDEAHHAVAGMWMKILVDALPDAKVLGVTATPERFDGKGLAGVFETLILGPTIGELVETSFLSPFVTYAPAEQPDLTGVATRLGEYALDQLGDVMADEVVIGRAVDEYKRHCPGAPAIAFCVNIRHSQIVAARFTAAGFRAAHVDGDTDKDERRHLIQKLGTGELQVLTNCGLISEGVDVPAVVAAILLRPTKSLALYLQQVGRALRPAPGKERALILDCAGNAHVHGTVGMEREWTLEDRPKKPFSGPVVKRCKECGAINPISAKHCEVCAAHFHVDTPIKETDPGDLIPFDDLAAMPYRALIDWADGDRHRLERIARARGYKRGWVWHVLNDGKDAGEQQP
jgi:superfamily II DNA or RNA helicase